MTWEMIFVLGLLVVGLILFILEKIPTDLTSMLLFSSIAIVSLVSHSDALPSINVLLSVFSNPAPLTIAAMFIISAALEKCGVIEIIAFRLEKVTFLSYSLLLGLVVLIVAFFSAFLNNTAVVVILLPVVLSLSKTVKVPASKFLIPLSYASIFGGCCTAIGTSTNILVSGVMDSYGMEPLTMFELSAVGVPLLLVSAIYLAIFGDKLLPVRETLSSILSNEGLKEYFTEAFVPRDSPLIGQTLKEAGFFKTPGLRVLEVVRRSISMETELHQLKLKAGDRVVFALKPSGASKAGSIEGVDFSGYFKLGLEQIAEHKGAIVEGIVGPHSWLIGQTVKGAHFRQRFRMALLAVHRKGANVREKLGTLRLEFGDTLLMMGTDEAVENLRYGEDVILVDKAPIPAQDMRKKIPIALGVLGGIVLAVTLNLVPIVGASFVGVTVIFLTGCLTPKEGYLAIEWKILVLIYGMLALGISMQTCGLSTYIAESFVSLGGIVGEGYRPLFLLAGLYICTDVLTEVLSNNATAALMTPIGIGLAAVLGVDPRPFIIAVCIASSASFSTPIGYQTNTYVYGVGGYRFSDFWKVGLPLNLIYFVGCMLIIPRVWHF